MAFATKPDNEFNSWNPHDEERDLTPESCLQTFTPWHVHGLAPTYNK